ncbi:MAG: hypothetical protein ABI944_04205 [Chthoniobacterales bacterium]
MKKLTLSLCALVALGTAAYAGPSYSGKEMKQTVEQVAPCPTWYADREFNVDLFGTYAFTGTEYRNDRYLGVDHAWGGGIDIKYFFARYFGFGVEGYGLALNERRGIVFAGTTVDREDRHDRGGAGAVLGTFTFRYPIPCTRFAPYVFGGGGGIFGGGGRTFLTTEGTEVRDDSRSELIGQFGGGFEVRFTPHIGLINDFSWNVVNGSHNNFGMARTGLNFAF